MKLGNAIAILTVFGLFLLAMTWVAKSNGL